MAAVIERIIRETYATHCILTNVGFEPDQIYVATQPVANARRPGLYATVTLKRGKHQFVLTLCPVTDAEAVLYLEAWRAFALAKPSKSRDELDAILLGSSVYAQRADLVTALVSKGFKLRPGSIPN